MHVERQLQVPGQCRGLEKYVSLKQMLRCFLAPNLLLFAHVPVAVRDGEPVVYSWQHSDAAALACGLLPWGYEWYSVVCPSRIQ